MLKEPLSLNNDLKFSKKFPEFSGRKEPYKSEHQGALLGQWLLSVPKLQAYRDKIVKGMSLLNEGSVDSLSTALGGLRHQIEASLPIGVGAMVWNASCESSPTLFAQSLVEIAQAYRNKGDFATPVGLYSLALKVLPKNENQQAFRQQLTRELSTLQGKSTLNDQLRFGLERGRHEIKSPLIAAMAAGSLANPLTSRLLGNFLRGRLTQVARVGLSRLGGVGADAMAFTSVQHSIALASGQPTNSLAHDFLHAGLMLTSLRVTGTLTRTALRTQAAQNVLRNFGALSRRGTQTGLTLLAEYEGVLRANRLGASLGIGEVGPHAGLDTLFTMGHFRLAHAILRSSPHYSRAHRQLTLETETTLRDAGHRTLQRLKYARWGAPSLKRVSGLSLATADQFKDNFGLSFMANGPSRRVDPRTVGILRPNPAANPKSFLESPKVQLRHVVGRTINMSEAGVPRQSIGYKVAWRLKKGRLAYQSRTREVARVIIEITSQNEGRWVVVVANDAFGKALMENLDSEQFHLINYSRGRIRKPPPQTGPAASKHLLVPGAMIQGFNGNMGSFRGVILTYQMLLSKIRPENLNPIFPLQPEGPFDFVEFDYGNPNTRTLGDYHADLLQRTTDGQWRLKTEVAEIAHAEQTQPPHILARVQLQAFYRNRQWRDMGQEQLAEFLHGQLDTLLARPDSYDAEAYNHFLELVNMLRGPEAALREGLVLRRGLEIERLINPIETLDEDSIKNDPIIGKLDESLAQIPEQDPIHQLLRNEVYRGALWDKFIKASESFQLRPSPSFGPRPGSRSDLLEIFGRYHHNGQSGFS